MSSNDPRYVRNGRKLYHASPWHPWESAARCARRCGLSLPAFCKAAALGHTPNERTIESRLLTPQEIATGEHGLGTCLYRLRR